jgi:hypothetical protein
MSLRGKLSVYGFPVALRVARVVNTIIGLTSASQVFDNKSSPIYGTEQVWQAQRETKVECMLQVIDNS